MNIVCVARRRESRSPRLGGASPTYAGSLPRPRAVLEATPPVSFYLLTTVVPGLAEPSLDKHRAAEYTRLYEEIIRRVQALPVQPVVGESAPLR